MFKDFNMIGDDKLKNGGKRKFIVLNCWDATKYLSDEQKKNLEDICNTINTGRGFDKKPENEYMVINNDEPYAPEVVEILKKNGHWG